MSACRRHYPGRTDGTDSLVPFPRRRPSPHYSWVSSCIISFEACSAFTRVTTCRLAESPYATLSTGGFSGFVAFTAAPIATGRSDPVPGRVFHPAVDQRLFTAHCNGLITPFRQIASPIRAPKRLECGHESTLLSGSWSTYILSGCRARAVFLCD